MERCDSHHEVTRSVIGVDAAIVMAVMIVIISQTITRRRRRRRIT